MKKSLLTWVLSLAVATAVALPSFAGAPGGAPGAAPGAGGAGGFGGAGGGRGAGGAGGAGGGRGTAGGRGAMDPAAQIEGVLTAIRAQMVVEKEDEWKIISDRLKKVLEIEQKLATIPNPLTAGGRGGGGGGGGGGGRGGRGGGGGAPGGAPAVAVPAADPNNPLAVAMASLNTSIADPAVKADELNPKVAAVRAAHKKLTADLTVAQADLQKYLSVRQEAILVSRGILD